MQPNRFRFTDLIARKRDRGALTGDEIQAVVDAVTHKTVPDYQISAWLMAVFLNGMTADERTALTLAMTRSGRVLDHSHLHGSKADKHSTGGIGDKVSICLAPAVAACGVWVPMVSGRGLGHTGGTLDKLEAIPGLRTRLDVPEFTRVLEAAGFVMGGQSADIAPADKTLYALRDVTATVESLPLIASSIMSKKLAEGIDALVLDVKVGSGAFMKTLADARALATALVELGKGVGVATTAFLTDMDQPLGLAIGNANETAEAIDVLHGKGPADLIELTAILGGEMLRLGGVARNLDEGKAKIRASFADGSALARMKTMVELQGGDPTVCDDTSRLPRPAFRGELLAARSGVVTGFETAGLGYTIIALGGGRNTAEDVVHPEVGIDLLVKRGHVVKAGDPIAVVGARSADDLAMGLGRLRAQIHIGDTAAAEPPLILEVIH